MPNQEPEELPDASTDQVGGPEPTTPANGGRDGNGGPSDRGTGNGGPLERYPGISLSIVSLLATAVIGVLLYIMARPDGSVVSQLSESAYARGLITFLFTLGTIVIAILLTLNAVSRRAGDAGKGFQDAKEILTVLVGILGTIIGFYFGQEQAEGGRPLGLSTELSAEEVPEEGDVTLAALGSGGVPPYTFEVVADGPVDSAQSTGESETGWWLDQLSAAQVDADSPVRIDVTVTDAEGSSKSSSLDLLVQDGQQI